MTKPRKGIRLSLREAEAEFGTHRDTLSKLLLQAGEKPGEDGRWSIQQVCAQVFTDERRERARLAKEQADRVAIDNAKQRREWIPVEDAAKLNGRIAFAIRQKIVLLPNLTTEEKNEILTDIRRLASVDFTKVPDPEEDAQG